MHTSGNSREKDMIYHIYGRDITSGLLEIDHKNEYFHVKGFIGKPLISRGNRNFENYFINGRYIKSALLSKSIEEAYMVDKGEKCPKYQAPVSVLRSVLFHGYRSFRCQRASDEDGTPFFKQ